MRNGWFALAVVSLCLPACGDDDGGNQVSSGLPANEPLSSLDASESEKLCSAFGDAIDEALTDTERERITCTALALPLSVTESASGEPQGDPAQCRTLVNRCLKGEKISDEMVDFAFDDIEVDCSRITSTSLDACDATVREFESCMSAIVDTYEQSFELIDCQQLADIDELMKQLAERDTEVSSLPACSSLFDKCPELE